MGKPATLAERYADLFALAPVPLVLVSPDGIIRMTNEHLDATFEYGQGELVGQPVERLLPPDDREHHPALRAAYHRVPVRRAMGQGRELRGRTRSGATIPLELALNPVEWEGERWALVTAIDISARKANESLAQTALEAAATATLMVRPDGEIVYANRQALLLFDYERSQMIGAPIEDLVPADVADRHHRYREGFLHEERSRAMGEGKQLHGRRRDGSEFRLEVALTPITWEGERMVLATVVDLAERLAIEREQAAREAAEAQARELRRLNDELTQFSYSASHDLKAPFASIQGMADVCLEDLNAQDEPSLRHNLRRIAEIAERSANKVEAVLRLATAGDEPLGRAAIDLEAVVQHLWRALPSNALSPSSLVLDIGHHAPFFCDREALMVVLHQLLANAVRFRAHDRPSWVRVCSWQVRESIVITVNDNGVGIDGEQAEQMFQPFSRLHPRAGDGLGLALVRRYVQRMGGVVRARVVEEGITEVRVRLPLEGVGD
ncbi:MAG: PAS domain S-box protein [Pseudomonadota bacterium]